MTRAHLCVGDRKVVVIESVGAHGEGVARAEDFVIFIPGALLGEEVLVEMTEVRRNYAKARLCSIHKPHELRQKPMCPLFGKCGGCHLMHANYDLQLQMKRKKVQDAIERIGGLDSHKVFPCISAPKPLAYRNKIILPVALVEGKKVMGLYAASSHDVVPVNQCAIHMELGERVFNQLQRLIQEHPTLLRHIMIRSSLYADASLVLLSGWHAPDAHVQQLASKIAEVIPTVKGVLYQHNPHDSNAILQGDIHSLWGASSIEEELLGVRFNISAPSFFQVNPWQAAQLYKYVASAAQLAHNHRVVDAYCGVGTLSLFLAKLCERVVGIECVAPAVEDAKINAQRNGIDNALFVCGETEKTLEKQLPADVVVINPPRKGCEPAVLQALCNNPPERLIYVSCDPATLARDLKILVEKHFVLQEVQPFDMFPQTYHVESVATLVRRQHGTSLS